MSLYIQWINRIKTEATDEWLTISQRNAYDRLLNFGTTEPFVSFYGPSGSGKSFIARLLERNHGYVHVPSLDQVPPGASLVVVDGEEYSRLMRPVAMIRQLRRIIVVSRRAARDPMPRVELVLNERDVRQFQNTLIRHGIMTSFLASHRGADLGKILRDEAILRGHSNGTE